MKPPSPTPPNPDTFHKRLAARRRVNDRRTRRLALLTHCGFDLAAQAAVARYLSKVSP